MLKKIRLVTHQYVDVDAVVSTCTEAVLQGITPSEETVKFVPSATTMDELEDGDYPIDIAAKKHGNGLSYVGEFLAGGVLPEYLVEEVNQQDSEGSSSSRVPLATILNALREIGKTDLEIIQAFMPIIQGMMKMEDSWREAKEIFPTLEKIIISGYEFLITENEENHNLGKIAQMNGMTGTIFQSSSGWGITRYPGKTEPDLSVLKLDGWFSHPAGFLFCWGSRKSPKRIPPPQFPYMEDFINWLDDNIPTLYEE